eukprot:scaffold1006_cov408-Prasinococcus_capsulatus_cf.AAC.29
MADMHGPAMSSSWGLETEWRGTASCRPSAPCWMTQLTCCYQASSIRCPASAPSLRRRRSGSGMAVSPSLTNGCIIWRSRPSGPYGLRAPDL